MGCTLRATLDALPADARVVVAELNAAVPGWCRTFLAELTGAALCDPRVELHIDDGAATIRDAAHPEAKRFEAILLDLYEGPHPTARARRHPHYGDAALSRARSALVPGGVLAVWSEDPDASFERRLARAGFRVQRARPGRGGRRHAVTLGVASPGIASSPGARAVPAPQPPSSR